MGVSYYIHYFYNFIFVRNIWRSWCWLESAKQIMTTIPQLLRSRTVLFALVLAVLSVVQGYVALLPVTPVQQMYVGMAISVAITLLRIVTTQPLSEK